MFEGEPDRFEKTASPDGNVCSGLPKAKIGDKSAEQTDILPGPSITNRKTSGPQFERRRFPHQLTHKPTGAGPTAKSPANQQNTDGQKQPETPEHRENTAMAGDDGAVLAAHIGHKKRAAKDAVERPLTEGPEEQRL